MESFGGAAEFLRNKLKSSQVQEGALCVSSGGISRTEDVFLATASFLK